MKKIHYISSCRLCNSNKIFKALKLSSIYYGEKYFKSLNQAKKEKKIPQTLVFCKSCCAVQIREKINFTKLDLFKQN